MSVRRSRGRRRVGLRGGCPFKEAGGTREGRMRPSLVQEAKRTSSACLRGIQPEGPGSCRQEPEHVAPVTGYGAKAPAGFPLWMSMVNSGAAIPGRNDRYGARCDAQRLSQDRQQDYPRRFTPRPAPSIGRRATASRRAARVRMRDRAHRSARPGLHCSILLRSITKHPLALFAARIVFDTWTSRALVPHHRRSRRGIVLRPARCLAAIRIAAGCKIRPRTAHACECPD